jgi:hypothetical protein
MTWNLHGREILKSRISIYEYVVLYGCETRFPTLREEHKVQMFKKKVLRKISNPNKAEVKSSK